jgi:hypothetical protein
MSATAYNVRWRLLIAVTAVLIASAIYLPAEAEAAGFHDFYRAFVHPWGRAALSWCILGLCVIALSATWPLLRFGSWIERVGAVAVWIVPVFIISHYLAWLVHQWAAA